MYDFLKFKLSTTENIFRFRFAPILKRFTSRSNPIEIDFVYDDQSDDGRYCTLKVKDKKSLEKLGIEFPLYIFKYGKGLKSVELDLVGGTKFCTNLNVNLYDYICGYIRADEVAKIGKKNLEKEISEIAVKARKPYKLGFSNPNKTQYKISDDVILHDNVKYCPVMFRTTPNELNLKNKNLNSTDYRYFLEHLYSDYNYAIAKIFGDDEKQKTLRSDIVGNIVDFQSETAYISKVPR